MNIESTPYSKWVENLKYGDLVLLVDGQWSYPVIFSKWNGDSSSSGYRAHYYYIQSYEERLKDLTDSKDFHISSLNVNAEKRFYPFPEKLLTKVQLKFYKLFKHFKL